MKTTLLNISLCAATLFAMADAPDVRADEQIHRPFYGYFLTNDYFGRLSWGVADQYFDNTEYSDLLYDFGDSPNKYGIYAGTGIDGLIYMCQYEYISSLDIPQPRNMAVYNTFNGHLTEIGPWATESMTMKPTDMTYDYLTKTLYAIGFDNGTTYLYKVNPETAHFTEICTLGGGATLAAAPDGKLYTIDLDGILYNINLQTGAMVKVFDTGLTGMTNLQSMEFDRTNGKLYWASNCSSNDSHNIWLQEIDLSDLANVTMTPIGKIGLNAVFMSMYIPACSSFEAPAAPSDIRSVTTDPNVLNASLSWTNPTTDFAGNEIETLNGVVLFRNGEQLKVFTGVTPGQQMSFLDDTLPTDGEYRYDIMAFNSKGDGMKGTVFSYIGKDSPAAPKNIDITVDEDFMGATVSWEAPSVGAHDGALDLSEIRYNVTRMPDELKIAEGVETTSVTDSRFNRLLNYYYEIEAYNQIGSSKAVSKSTIIGPALEPPMTEYFEDYDLISHRWMTVDANADGFSWIFCSTLSHDIFGDFETAAEYILTPTSVDETLKDADEWLVSAPLKFESDKEFELSFRARSYAYEPQYVELYFGPSADISKMTKIGDAEIDLNELDPLTGTMSLARYTFDIPAGTPIGCVAIRLAQPVPDSKMCFLQIGEIDVVERGTYGSGVSKISVSDTGVSLHDRQLTINVAFESAAIYKTDGQKVIDIKDSTTNLNGLSSGVYILTIDNRTLKFAL